MTMMMIIIIIIIIIIEILGAQDQVLHTKYHATIMLQTLKTASAEHVNSWIRIRPHYFKHTQYWEKCDMNSTAL
jgi:membrane associated rhomboid family serine protease